MCAERGREDGSEAHPPVVSVNSTRPLQGGDESCFQLNFFPLNLFIYFFCVQFRFADRWDVLMIIAGTVMSMANGVVLPLMFIVLGDMTDSFIAQAASEFQMQACVHTGSSAIIIKG